MSKITGNIQASGCGAFTESEVDTLCPADGQTGSRTGGWLLLPGTDGSGSLVDVKLFLVAHRRLYSIHPVLIGLCTYLNFCFKGSEDSGVITEDSRRRTLRRNAGRCL